MTVQLYAHTSNIDDMNERRAICRLARTLQLSDCGRSPDNHYLFIGNIDPSKDPKLQAQGHLTQLDGLLLGHNFIAIVDFKNYFDPIEANRLDGDWFVRSGKQRMLVKGGSKKNPYRQARNARRALHDYLVALEPTLFGKNSQKSWDAIYSFVLFHPALHPQSRLPPLGKEGYWLQFRSVDAIAELALSTHSRVLELSTEKMEALAKNAFLAQPWGEMNDLLKNEWGYMYIQEPGDTGDKTPVKIRLWRHDDFTIGRSSKYGHRIKLEHDKVSRAHARITVDDNNHIHIYDLQSKNGTYVDGHRIDSTSGQILSEDAKVQLGGIGSDICHIWFERKPVSVRTYSTQ